MTHNRERQRTRNRDMRDKKTREGASFLTLWHERQLTILMSSAHGRGHARARAYKIIG